MRTALIGGVLIDGSGGPPRRDATLVIEGSKIVDVGHQRTFGPEVRVVDLAGRTVMPGLIDCHIHFAHWGMNLIALPEPESHAPGRRDGRARCGPRSRRAARPPGTSAGSTPGSARRWPGA